MMTLRHFSLYSAFVVAAAAGFLIPGKASTPEIAAQWEYEVFATDLPSVDNLALAPDGSLYASLELPDGEGQIIHIRNDERTVILGDLYRPDGLILVSGFLFLTEEVEDGRVMSVNLEDQSSILITTLQKPEGIGMLSDGRLVITEDLEGEGRVVMVTLNGQVSTIARDLDKPEGLFIGGGENIYLAESGAGRVLTLTGEHSRTVVDGLQHPDQISFADDGALWITEDRADGRLMRFAGGELESILEGISNPQGLVFGDDGWLYVAEQGRDRIIRLRRTT